jgi:hypothetical protein
MRAAHDQNAAAPLPIAALMVVGAASPTVQGQATSSIVMARRTSLVTPSVVAATAKEVWPD